MPVLLRTCIHTIATLCLLLNCPAQLAAAARPFTAAERTLLIEMFHSPPAPNEAARELFTDPRLRYLPGIVRRTITTRDRPEHYQRFLMPVSIAMAKKFQRHWRTLLRTTGQSSGVSPAIITAILLVETSLGHYTGTTPVASVFASILVDNATTSTEAEAPAPYRRRLVQKATWAREELQALLHLGSRHDLDIIGLRGSYAGAFGIAQFLPSSCLRWGRSHRGTAPPDLFHMPDAIVSVAHYLQQHGWKPGLSAAACREVLWTYNHSSAYVDTIMAVAGRLGFEPSGTSPTVNASGPVETPPQS